MIKNTEFTYWERKNGADIALLDITDGKAKIAYRRGVWIGPKFEIEIIAWPFEGETFPVQLDKDREEYIEVFGEKLYLGSMRMGTLIFRPTKNNADMPNGGKSTKPKRITGVKQ